MTATTQPTHSSASPPTTHMHSLGKLTSDHANCREAFTAVDPAETICQSKPPLQSAASQQKKHTRSTERHKGQRSSSADRKKSQERCMCESTKTANNTDMFLITDNTHSQCRSCELKNCTLSQCSFDLLSFIQSFIFCHWLSCQGAHLAGAYSS